MLHTISVVGDVFILDGNPVEIELMGTFSVLGGAEDVQLVMILGDVESNKLSPIVSGSCVGDSQISDCSTGSAPISLGTIWLGKNHTSSAELPLSNPFKTAWLNKELSPNISRGSGI